MVTGIFSEEEEELYELAEAVLRSSKMSKIRQL